MAAWLFHQMIWAKSSYFI